MNWLVRIATRATRSGAQRSADQALEQPGEDLQALAIVYQTVSASLASVNQTRWSLISNYLLANSFLLVAWATVFTYEPTSSGPAPQFATVVRGHILFGIAMFGLVLSLLWWHLVNWINPYVGMGHAAGEAAERKLLVSLVPKCEKPGPDEKQAQGDCCRKLPEGRERCKELSETRS